MGNSLTTIDIINNNLLSSDELLLFTTSLMLKGMFYRYVLPIARQFLPAKHKQSSQNVRWTQNRKYIAAHVKSAFEKVKVYVVSSESLCNELVSQRMLGSNDVKFIGLDCEWDSTKKNGVGLIQISSGNDCILYRSSKANGVLPVNLKKLLEDRKVLKFGVAIQEDVRRLRSHGVQVKGFVDLRNLAQRCVPIGEQMSTQEEEMYQWTSLRSLSYNALDMRLSKNHHIRCGDWEAPILSKPQILYAAKDAVVSLEIFYALVLLRKLGRKPQRDALKGSFVSEVETIYSWLDGQTWDSFNMSVCCYCHQEDQLSNIDTILPSKFVYTKPSSWLSELSYSLCQGIVDINHKPRPPMGMRGNVTSNTKNITASRAFSTKAETKPKVYKHSCREKPLYENCFLIGPDKKVLATVNRTKAQWYVHKELGEVEKETPFTVRLLFEPSGRPMPDADYYTTVKENICVVCGGTESFVRKMVVPHDYRKYFPLELKDHMSHDVLLMCLSCHRMAQIYDEELRQQLALKYNAPLGTKEHMLFIDNPHLGKVRSAAKALLKGGSKIPEKRREELEEVVRNYYKVDVINEELLQKAMHLNIKEANKQFTGLHGQRVVNAVLLGGTIPEFVRLWRQRFLDYMSPKFLPPMWSVDHNLHKFKGIVIAEEKEVTMH